MIDKLKETTSKRIKELRIKNNLTMEVLAEKIGVSKSTIAKWENGYVENMRQDNILKLSKLFNVPATYIMGYDEPNDIDMGNNNSSNELTVNERAKKTIELYLSLEEKDQDIIDGMLSALTSKK
jgi:transcriptional regulator with XRE-family HTH domain